MYQNIKTEIQYYIEKNQYQEKHWHPTFTSDLFININS